MQPLLGRLTTQLKTVLDRIPRERRTQALVSFGLMGVAIVVILIWAFRPQYKPLYADLSLEDSGEIVQLLQKEHIPYRLDQEGRRILVL